MEKTLESSWTILGLASSASTSLLSVKYSKGTNAVDSCNVGDADKSACKACAEMVLSPVRFVQDVLTIGRLFLGIAFRD